MDNILSYFASLEEGWKKEYQKNQIDYGKLLYKKIYGNETYYFMKRYNREMRRLAKEDKDFKDYDVVPEYYGFMLRLSDWHDYDQEERWWPKDHNSHDIKKYFQNESDDFYDVDSCREFKISKLITFPNECIHITHNQSFSMLPQLRLTTHRSYNSANLIDKFNELRLVAKSFNHCDRYDSSKITNYQILTIYIPTSICITICYCSDFDRSQQDTFYVNNHMIKWNEDHDMMLFTSSDKLITLHMVSTKPLFSDVLCKFGHNLEKLEYSFNHRHKIYNPYLTYNSNPYAAMKPENQYLHQLLVKHFLIDNKVIRDLFVYLNSTKSPDFKYDKKSALGYFLKYIESTGYPDQRGEFFDERFWYRMKLCNSIPKWLNLSDSFAEITIQGIHNGQFFITGHPNFMRSSLSSKTVSSVHDVIDQANLYLQNASSIQHSS